MLAGGSRQQDIWGADWHPDTSTVAFGALINIRPGQGNRSLDVQDAELRTAIERIVRNLLEAKR